MRAVVQRVRRASVTVGGEIVGAIERGFLVLLGAGQGDSEADAEYLARKITGLRVFEDDDGRMNLALDKLEADDGTPDPGKLLVVSQFTLYGDTRKGRRPSFVDALEPERASELVDHFVDAARPGTRCGSRRRRVRRSHGSRARQRRTRDADSRGARRIWRQAHILNLDDSRVSAGETTQAVFTAVESTDRHP